MLKGAMLRGKPIHNSDSHCLELSSHRDSSDKITMSYFGLVDMMARGWIRLQQVLEVETKSIRYVDRCFIHVYIN